jgi:4-amino-4-deoxy-L-arabinose transferase-like glycosyltransferase
MFSLVITAYIVMLGSVGRFSTTDEVFFKAAGREWARSGRFAAPELKGFLHLQPPVEFAWFAQFPLYTFLFGVFVKVLGFSAVSSVLFDALIHVALSVATYLLVIKLSREPKVWMAVAAGLVVLFIGTTGRPDELACLWGVLAGLQLTSVSDWKRSGLFGIFLGLCVSTNIVAGVVFMLILAPPYFRRVRCDERASWRSYLATALGGSFAAVMTILPFLMVGHQVYRQFFTHASRQFANPLSYAAKYSFRFGAPYWCVIVGSLAVCIDECIRSRRTEGLGCWFERWGGVLAALIFLMVFTLSKPYYLWFLGPWLIAVSFVSLSERPSTFLRQNDRALYTPSVIIVMALAYGIGCAPFFQSALIMASLPAGQRLASNVSLLEATIPKGSSILASEFWSSLGNDYRYYAPLHSAVDPRSVDFVILTGNGTGVPGQPQSLGWWKDEILKHGFEVVLDHLNREPTRFLGIRISRSAYGFGPLVLRNLRSVGVNEWR